MLTLPKSLASAVSCLSVALAVACNPIPTSYTPDQTARVDLDGDGIPETVMADTDGDGTFDTPLADVADPEEQNPYPVPDFTTGWF